MNMTEGHTNSKQPAGLAAVQRRNPDLRSFLGDVLTQLRIQTQPIGHEEVKGLESGLATVMANRTQDDDGRRFRTAKH